MKRRASWIVGVLVLVAARALAQQPAPTPGLLEAPRLYAEHCASCHDRPEATRAPSQDALAQRTPEAILTALTSGAMATQGGSLSERQRRALAAFLSGRAFGSAESGAASAMPNRCADKPLGNPFEGASWNGWGNSRGNTRFQPNPGFSADQVPKLTVKWAFGLPNAASAYAQPTVVGGRVYLGSDTGIVYAIDAASGCVFWSFAANAGVRTAISIGPIKGDGAGYAAYFGDVHANVYAVDAATGKALWTARVEKHPLARITGSPTLYEGRLFVPVASIEEAAAATPRYECCTFRGSLTALDAMTGKEIWKSYTVARSPAPTRKTSTGTQLYGPSGSGIWSSPTIDAGRRLVYVATGDAYSEPVDDSSDAIIAFDLDTGRRRWARQLTAADAYIVGCDGVTAAPGARSENCPEKLGPDFDFGSSAILATLPNGRTIVTAGQKSGIAWGLDPDKQGKILWQQRVGKGETGGGVVFGPAADGERGYFATNDQSRGAEAGGLSAVNLADGAHVWSARPTCPTGRRCQPAQPGAVTVIPGAVFSGTLDGIMRAYSTKDGRLLWEFDTAREFPTVNRVAARGGAMSGPGAVAAGGMLFVVSGYSWLSGSGAGNVLLAFSTETSQ